MSVKYHVNENGKPGICRAQPGRCPFGGAESHFATEEEAYQHGQRNLGSNYGVVPALNEVDRGNKRNRNSIIIVLDEWKYQD